MIVFLSGSINSGKSTVAKILARELANTALVEVDALREMIDWMPIDKSIPINLENAVSVVRNFLAKGLNVVVPYPLSQKNYDYLAGELKDLKEKKYFFTLAPKIEIALSDRGDRKLNESERGRIKHHYEIGISRPSFGEVIDNSGQLPEQTAKIILDLIHSKKN